MFRDRSYRAEAFLVAAAFLSYLLINSGYFLWWGLVLRAAPLIPALPFLALPLIFVPRRLFPLVALLGLVSAAQMFIAAASQVLVPDDIYRRSTGWAISIFHPLQRLPAAAAEGQICLERRPGALRPGALAGLLPLFLALLGLTGHLFWANLPR
jgi:hypothetical protein